MRQRDGNATHWHMRPKYLVVVPQDLGRWGGGWCEKRHARLETQLL